MYAINSSGDAKGASAVVLNGAISPAFVRFCSSLLSCKAWTTPTLLFQRLSIAAALSIEIQTRCSPIVAECPWSLEDYVLARKKPLWRNSVIRWRWLPLERSKQKRACCSCLPYHSFFFRCLFLRAPQASLTFFEATLRNTDSAYSSTAFFLVVYGSNSLLLCL